jgi:hypothetical protein
MTQLENRDEARAGLEFDTDGTFVRRLKTAFGVFVALTGAVPCCILAVEWVTIGAAQMQTNPVSIFPGLLIVLWGFGYSATREKVRVDPKARTVTWRVTTFGVAWRTASWAWSDIHAIRVVVNGTIRSSGRRAEATGPKGRRTLASSFHRRPPEVIRALASLLGVPLIDAK